MRLDYECKPPDSQRMSAVDVISVIVCCLILAGAPVWVFLVLLLMAALVG